MTGKTRDLGRQVGARRTFPLETAEAWNLMCSKPWLQRWSGLAALELDDPAVRSLTTGRLARVHTRHSLVQLRVLPAARGTTVAFHEEHLPDEPTRIQRKDHWTHLLDDFGAALPAT